MRCTQCGNETMKHRNVKTEVAIGHSTFEAPIAGWVCSKCGDSILDGPSLERFEWVIAVLLAKLGASDGAAFKHMRKALGLKASELAERLDVAPETISRWENGQREIERAALVTLASLVVDEDEGRHTVKRILEALQHPPKATRHRIRVARPSARGRRLQGRPPTAITR